MQRVQGGGQPLPEDVLHQVLPRLGSSDLGNFRQACKELLLAVDCFVTCKRVARTDAGAVAAAAQRWPNVRQLSILPLEQGARKKIQNTGVLQLLRAAATHWPHLTTLALVPKDDHQVVESFECAATHLGARLTSLSLDWAAKLTTNMMTVSTLVGCFSRLVSLCWTCGSVSDGIVEQLARLTTLKQLQLGQPEAQPFEMMGMTNPCSYYHAGMYWGSNGEGWTGQPLSALTQLTSLQIIGSARFNVVDWSATCSSIQSLTMLEELTIETHRPYHVNIIAPALAPLQHLRSLHLGQELWHYNLTPQNFSSADSSFQHFANHSHLVELVLPTEGFNDAGLAALATCGSLRHLTVCTCEITEESVGVQLLVLETFVVTECFAMVPYLAELMPCLHTLTCIEQWDVESLEALYHHPQLSTVHYGHPHSATMDVVVSQAIAATMLSLPRLKLATYHLC